MARSPRKSSPKRKSKKTYKKKAPSSHKGKKRIPTLYTIPPRYIVSTTQLRRQV